MCAMTACRDAGIAHTGRAFREVQWDTAWITPRSVMDSLLPAATALAWTGGYLAVADASRPGVAALNPTDGSIRWARGRRGTGPGDFAEPIELLSLGGRVGVLDYLNRRIQRFDSSGELLGGTTLAAAGSQPNQACGLGAHVLVADVKRSRMLVLDSAGVAVDSVALPWVDLRARSEWSRQVMLRSDRMGLRCVIGLMSGRGFATVAFGRAPRAVSYVEAFEVTGVGDRTDERPGEAPYGAMLDADFSGDTVFVLFAGRTPDEYRVIDLYDVKASRYLESWRLPLETSEIAVGDKHLFARVRSDSIGPVIVALIRP